jgi:hypothetical protein
VVGEANAEHQSKNDLPAITTASGRDGRAPAVLVATDQGTGRDVVVLWCLVRAWDGDGSMIGANGGALEHLTVGGCVCMCVGVRVGG